MTTIPSVSSINRIEVFSHWLGFADPPSVSAKLTITNSGDHFVRQQALEATSDELPERVLTRLLNALARPAISHLDVTIFDVPSAAMEWHYGSCWTDDCPSHLIQIHCGANRRITIETHAQHAFMLPLKIIDSVSTTSYETFDPELSRALADLMPEGYLNRERLAGRSGMLEEDGKHVERMETEAAREPAAATQETTPVALESLPSAEELQANLFQILFGEESEQEARKAEQAGRLSERLLKRNSLEAVRDLLARGANPSVADDVGQTALMHAALPPFDRERFRLLVEAGADLEAWRNDGLTGLHIACAGGEGKAVAEWVRAGADTSATDPDGATPLMFGASWPRIVRTLLEVGVDVNAVDRDGHSALVYAILRQRSVSAHGQLKAMRALVDAGADVNLKDRAGVPAMGHAKRMLASALLEEEVISAYNPNAKLTLGNKWNDVKLAEAVVALLAAAGAHE